MLIHRPGFFLFFCLCFRDLRRPLHVFRENQQLHWHHVSIWIKDAKHHVNPSLWRLVSPGWPSRSWRTVSRLWLWTWSSGSLFRRNLTSCGRDFPSLTGPRVTTCPQNPALLRSAPVLKATPRSWRKQQTELRLGPHTDRMGHWPVLSYLHGRVYMKHDMLDSVRLVCLPCVHTGLLESECRVHLMELWRFSEGGALHDSRRFSNIPFSHKGKGSFCLFVCFFVLALQTDLGYFSVSLSIYIWSACV